MIAKSGGYAMLQSGMNMHGTTILCVKKGGQLVMAGDGQVSMGSQIMKHTATKIYRIGSDIVAGFAGSTSDAATMFERLENLVRQNPGSLEKICISFTRNVRTSGVRMDAMLLVANVSEMFVITGDGSVLRPEHDAVSVGSGSAYAMSAALALLDTDLTASEIADRAMRIAAATCVYTSDKIKKIVLESNEVAAERVLGPSFDDSAKE
jgi:ATP-dependent HslUV protease subunit HslV